MSRRGFGDRALYLHLALLDPLEPRKTQKGLQLGPGTLLEAIQASHTYCLFPLSALILVGHFVLASVHALPVLEINYMCGTFVA